MSRPYPQVPTQNHIAELRTHLESTLPGLARLPGIEGVTLNGGMSRGYADGMSEIDLTIYLADETFGRWSQGAVPLLSGIVMIAGRLYDIKVCNLEAEMQKPWSEVAKWDVSYSQILFDPRGRIAGLYAAKLAEPPSPAGVGRHLFDCWWHFHLSGDIWIHREDGLQAHHMLNRALEPLLAALFVANGEYVPHEKWLINFSRSLNWVPQQWTERLTAAMTIPAPTVEVAAARRQVIAGLWREIDQHVVQTQFPGYPLSLMQKQYYDLLKWLVDSGAVRLDEWTARSSAAKLYAAPFHACVTLDGQTVRLDRNRLKAIRPEDMYEWFYEIVAAVRAEL
ncbi:MAG TPA: hypothetical protein VGK74_23055 [Symbiobacteriaceae bacterium]|jgi:hypothetical protein